MSDCRPIQEKHGKNPKEEAKRVWCRVCMRDVEPFTNGRCPECNTQVSNDDRALVRADGTRGEGASLKKGVQDEEEDHLSVTDLLAILLALPVGAGAFWAAIGIGGPEVSCPVADPVRGSSVEPFLRLAAHGLTRSGFWSFLFSGVTLWWAFSIICCFAVGGALVGVITGTRAPRMGGSAMAIAVAVLPTLDFLQHDSVLLAVLRGQIMGAPVFLVIGTWLASAALASAASNCGMRSGTFLRKGMTGSRDSAPRLG